MTPVYRAKNMRLRVVRLSKPDDPFSVMPCRDQDASLLSEFHGRMPLRWNHDVFTHPHKLVSLQSLECSDDLLQHHLCRARASSLTRSFVVLASSAPRLHHDPSRVRDAEKESDGHGEKRNPWLRSRPPSHWAKTTESHDTCLVADSGRGLVRASETLFPSR
jgi:hypothetical protein